MGIEFNVTANVISSKDFTWSTNFNYTTQKNKVTALATGNADILVATGGLESPSIIRVGESIGSFYVIRTEGVNPANGRRVAGVERWYKSSVCASKQLDQSFGWNSISCT
jgi:hypothetical protein